MSQDTSRELSRRLAAVMFTDMAGYTALMQRDEAAALRSRQRHRDALEKSLGPHDGTLLQYFGDGSLSVFSSSVHAVEAAVEIQRALGGEPALRIGLHLGDIAYDEQGAYGDAINIAARLEALAVPGGILVSQKVFDDIKRHPDLAAVPAGAVRLKNVDDAVRTFALSVDGVAAPSGPVAGEDSAGPAPTAPKLPEPVQARLDERTRAPTYSIPTGTIPGRVPLVGRDAEVTALRQVLEGAERQRGITVFLKGPRGVGKTRLAQEAADYSKSRGWTVLTGRAYPAESLVPFGPFSDAFVPVLQGLDRQTLGALVPGGEDALLSLFPVLGQARRLPDVDGQPGDPQARLFWHFAALVGALAEHRPLLLILENLDFADRSSIDLFHFLARQCSGKSVCLIAEYAGVVQDRRQELLAVETSLSSMSAGASFELSPLNVEETDLFVRRAFDIERQDTTRLTRLVHHWTGGNPFFLMATLRGLVEARLLRREGGIWHGLDLAEIELPRSARDAVLVWMGTLSEPAVRLARLVAIVGAQVTYEALLLLADGSPEEVSEALDQLLRHQILEDSEQGFSLVYDFRHPLLRETLRGEMSLAERRNLHHHVALRLEEHFGEHAELHADELAYHFGHASPGDAGAKAVHYLASAGQSALARYASEEAVAYLQEALDRIEAEHPREAQATQGDDTTSRVMRGLARARRRLGHIQASLVLWRRVLARAEAAGDALSAARARREIGLSFTAGGRFEEAIEELELALEAARKAADLPLLVRILLAQGYCYHTGGRSEEAMSAVTSALAMAEEFRQPELISRVHLALMRLHMWTGRVGEVRDHAEKALKLSRESGDRTVEFWGQWAIGAMEGLIGNTGQMERHIEEARELAEDIGSPLLRLEVAELTVQLAYARGDWDEGLAVGGSAVDLARSLQARTLLPRLLVWVALIHLGRSNFEVADALTREAWEVSGADKTGDGSGSVDVHTVVPAHIGRAAYHLALGEWGEAARVAEAGLAIADRTGYIVWAIHYIIPIIGEASIHARNLARAQEIATRMRRDAEAVGHPLGLAWADAGDSVLTWLQGDADVGAVALRRGAESMERIPLIYEASRVRRQLAGRLAEIDDREGALEELRQVHAVFTRLGARHELEKTLRQFADLGAEPPA